MRLMIDAIGRFYDRIRALPQPIRIFCQVLALPIGLIAGAIAAWAFIQIVADGIRKGD
jgi:hypothetical protein